MAQGQTHTYDIPAQPAPEALNRFAGQSGLRILFPYEAVAGKRTRQVSGTMSEQAALDRLLADSGLVLVSRQGNVVTLGAPKFQDAPHAAEASPTVALDEVVVTASRLNRADVPTPLMTLTSEVLHQGARPNFIASLNDMPQFKASWSPTITGGSFSAGDSASIFAAWAPPVPWCSRMGEDWQAATPTAPPASICRSFPGLWWIASMS